MGKATKPGRRKPPKRGHKPERPVVSVRFDPKIFADIKAEANARRVTVTDVVHRRLVSYQALKWGMVDGTEKWLTPEERAEIAAANRELRIPVSDRVLEEERGSAWQKEMRRDVEADLKSLGYTRIVGPGGALWAEPDALIPASIIKALEGRKA
jgi:hypothetical protein